MIVTLSTIELTRFIQQVTHLQEEYKNSMFLLNMILYADWTALINDVSLILFVSFQLFNIISSKCDSWGV